MLKYVLIAKESIRMRERLFTVGQKPVLDPAPTQKKVDVSIIIPVYNEKNNIGRVISGLQEVVRSLKSTCEIIVVDDGSTDGSHQILGCIGGITYIRHSNNIGYGGALKSGIKKAKGDVIVIIDGDGTYPSEMIPDLIERLEECDMIVGARAKNDRNIPLVRRPAKWFLFKLANYLSETDIPDLNSGLRAFGKDTVLKFFGILPAGFSFTTTITLAMLCSGYDVRYIPVEYHKREGKSKIKPIRDTLNFIQLIGRTIMYFNPLRVFLPLACVCFLGFMLSSAIDIFILGNLTDKTVILFLAFIQVTVIGLLADLIVKRS